MMHRTRHERNNDLTSTLGSNHNLGSDAGSQGPASASGDRDDYKVHGMVKPYYDKLKFMEYLVDQKVGKIEDKKKQRE